MSWKSIILNLHWREIFPWRLHQVVVIFRGLTGQSSQKTVWRSKDDIMLLKDQTKTVDQWDETGTNEDKKWISVRLFNRRRHRGKSKVFLVLCKKETGPVWSTGLMWRGPRSVSGTKTLFFPRFSTNLGQINIGTDWILRFQNGCI